MKMNKKAGMLDSTIGQVVIGIALLVVIIGIIMAASGNLGSIWRGFARFLRFG